MTFKKIWNALKTDELRMELWNELTDKQKSSIVLDHPQHQLDRFCEKLTPVLDDQVDKWNTECGRILKILRKIRREGKRGIPKYLNSNIEDPKIEESQGEELYAALMKILNFYHASLGHVLIFQKSVDFTPQEIIDLELKYIWKDNESLEKQKEEWDEKYWEKTFLEEKKWNENTTEQHYSTGERLTDPHPPSENDVALEFRDRFLLGFDENEQEHNS